MPAAALTTFLAPLLSIPLAAVLLIFLRRRSRDGRVGFTAAALLTVTLLATLTAVLIAPAAVFQFLAFPADGLAECTAGVAVGAAATFALLARGLTRAHTPAQRHCPLCRYDMSATHGLVCPECGRNSRSEHRLHLARPRTWLLLLSPAPLVVALALYLAWFCRQPDWFVRIPTTALTAASPWLHDHRNSGMGNVLAARFGVLPSPPDYPVDDADRWLQAAVSGRVCRWATTPDTIVYHAELLAAMNADDDTTTDALIALTSNADPTAARRGAFALRLMHSGLESVEPTLLRMIETPDSKQAMYMLYALDVIKHRKPGGPPPPRVLELAGNSTDTDVRRCAMSALGGYEPTPESKSVFTQEVEMGRPARAVACAELCRTYLADPDTVDVVAGSLSGVSDELYRVFEALADADDRARLTNGDLPPHHLALYTLHLRANLLTAYSSFASHALDNRRPSPLPGMTRWLVDHPAFSESEREYIQGVYDRARAYAR